MRPTEKRSEADLGRSGVASTNVGAVEHSAATDRETLVRAGAEAINRHISEATLVQAAEGKPHAEEAVAAAVIDALLGRSPTPRVLTHAQRSKGVTDA